jgi:SAM-dependent methyltransferase
MELKKTFNEVIDDYDYARPKYPDELQEDIIQYSSINKSSRILEVGAGTGQTTDYYGKRGYDITALEIGEQQVEYLNKKYRDCENVKILCKPFEDYKSDNNYNLIFSATAFHWIKPELRYKNSSDLLKENGTLAVYWVTSLNRIVDSDIHKGLQKICQECVPGITVFYPDNYFIKVHQYRLNEMNRSESFKSIDYRVYKWVEEYSAKRYAALINTFEYIQVLPVKQRIDFLAKVENYICEHSGNISIPQQVGLYLLRK